MSERIMQASGTFEINLAPGEGLIEGTGRFDFTKTWHGEICGTGTGVMLSAGDPAGGTAGYVALERFQGSLADREGGFALQQFGSMVTAEQELRYQLVPGSGTGALTGITGTVALTIDADGTHRVRLDYTLPD